MALERAEEATAAPRYEGEVCGQGSVPGDKEEEVATSPPSEPDAVLRSLYDDRVTMQAADPKLLAANAQPVDRRRVDQRQAHRYPSDALTSSADHVDIVLDRSGRAQRPPRAVLSESLRG
jgi:hypothetical protein